MTRILVTGAGGAAAVSFMRALQGADVTLYAADIDPHAVGLFLVPEGRRVLLPRGDDPAYAETLCQVVDCLSIDVVVPTVDCELDVVASHRMRLQSLGAKVLVAPVPALRLCLDKAALMQAAGSLAGVPDWAIVDEVFDAAAWELPVIVKPRSGAGGRGVRLIREASDWDDVVRDGSLLVQEYLPGAEYSVDVLCSCDGDVMAAVPRIRLRVDSGVAIAARTVHDPVLESTAARLVQHLGLTHVSNVQLKRDRNGVPKLLEINPRFPGTMALTVHSGVNMPLWSLQDLLGLQPEPPERFRECAMARHWEEVFLPVAAFEGEAEKVA